MYAGEVSRGGNFSLAVGARPTYTVNARDKQSRVIVCVYSSECVCEAMKIVYYRSGESQQRL